MMKGMKKKKQTWLMIALILSLLLTACEGGGNSAAPEQGGSVSGGELTAEVFANYLRHKCLSDCTFLSKNARCQQTAGTLSEEDAAPLQRDNNKSQATRFLAA